MVFYLKWIGEGVTHALHLLFVRRNVQGSKHGVSPTCFSGTDASSRFSERSEGEIISA